MDGRFNDDDELEPYEVTNGIDFAATPPCKKWIIDGVLPEGVSALYGPSGSGKSFVALDIAGSIVTGKPFLGKFPVREGIVVYLQLEGELDSRWYLWRQVNGLLLTEEEKE